MKKIITTVFAWVFRSEMQKLHTLISECERERKALNTALNKVENLLGNIDVSVDVHHYAPSWAVISIQGQRADYIKFVELGDKDIRYIQDFLHQFERRKVDCSPMERHFFRRNKTYGIGNNFHN